MNASAKTLLRFPELGANDSDFTNLALYTISDHIKRLKTHKVEIYAVGNLIVYESFKRVGRITSPIYKN